MRLLPLFLLISFLYGYEDIGVIGPTYPVKEKSIKEEILEGLRNLDVKKIEKEMRASIEKAFTSHIDLPESLTDNTSTRRDFVLAEYDIPDPASPGRILYYKGTKIPSALPAGAKLELCFIDASDENLTKKIIEEFGQCDYMVSHRDIRHIDELNGFRVYPMNASYVYRFKIKTVPTKLLMHEDIIETRTLNVKRLREEIEKEKRDE